MIEPNSFLCSQAQLNAKMLDAYAHDAFDVAMVKFALAYADQAKRDHAGLKAAVRRGKIVAIKDA